MVKIGDSQLYVNQSGVGFPLIFLHAGIADSRMWKPQVDEYSSSYQTICWDRRGFGLSKARPDEIFSHVGDLEAIMTSQSLESGVLVGCSQGGRVAIDFALKNPTGVKALILIAPAISGASFPENFPLPIQQRIERLEIAEEANEISVINQLEIGLWLDGPQSTEGRVGGALRKLLLDMNEVALRSPELIGEADPPSAWNRIREIDVPTLVIHGNLDFSFIADRCRYLSSEIPGAEQLEIEGAAHMVNLEKPNEVNQAIHKFLHQNTLF
jgi:pimeloyl-ACP methyl ester carboxylesterase